MLKFFGILKFTTSVLLPAPLTIITTVSVQDGMERNENKGTRAVTAALLKALVLAAFDLTHFGFVHFLHCVHLLPVSPSQCSSELDIARWNSHRTT